MNDKQRIADIQALRDDLAKTKDTLGALITWIAQSANSPISVEDAVRLRKMLTPNIK